jgi:pSer/pThr/pTyr-binding forkhead associated (FHA) protein
VGSIHKLIIEDDEGKTTVVPVSRGEISIGRMEGNTIRLMERNVSRRHARLLRENGSIFIEDLNSFNGVKINGERIDKRIELKEGDLVEIGDYHLALQASHVEDDGMAHAREATGQSLTQANTVPGGAGHPSAPAAPAGLDAPWRGAGAATLPDFRAPEEILADIPAGMVLGPQPGARPPAPQPLPPFPGSVPPDAPPRPAGRPEGQRTAQIQVGPARTSDQPRLICVSTEYAGRDFPVNRPELVIGRVEDNDIVIEHRSVSRNHAKIVFDGRVHKIIDLESANGILVNGEEYAITDLRKGDLIELGHVRFRFIPAGEAFVATDEENRAMVEAGVAPLASLPMAGAAAPAAMPVPPPPQRLEPLAPAPLPPAARPPQRNSEPSKTVEDPHGHVGTVEIPGMAVSVDPSNAATVTDTPLSALGVPELFQPKVDGPGLPAPSTRSSESVRASHDARNGASTLNNGALHREEPPTEVAKARSGPRAPVPSSAARPAARPVPTRPPSDLDDGRGDGRSKVFAAAVLLVVVIGALVFGAFKLRGHGDDVADREIRALFDAGDWAGVENYYFQHRTRFRDKEKAEELSSQAHERRLKSPSPDAPKTELNAAPSGPKEAPEAAARPAGASADELPAGEDSDEPGKRPAKAGAGGAGGAAPGAGAPGAAGAAGASGAGVAGAAGAAGAAAASGAAAKKDKGLDRAKSLEHEGRKALLDGELVRAENLMMLCLKVADYGPCHRGLGVIYSNRGDEKRSIEEYERYLQLEPTAPDAIRIRETIKSARGH